MTRCEAFQQDLKAYLDGELPRFRRLAVQRHLARCEACREESHRMKRMAEELRAPGIDPLEPALRAKILATLRETAATAPAPAPSPRRRIPLVWVAATAAAVLLGIFFYPNRFAPKSVALMHSEVTASAPAGGGLQAQGGVAMPSAPTGEAVGPPVSELKAPSDHTASNSRFARTLAPERAQKVQVPAPLPAKVATSPVTTFQDGNASLSGKMPQVTPSAQIMRPNDLRSGGSRDSRASSSFSSGEPERMKAKASLPRAVPLNLPKGSARRWQDIPAHQHTPVTRATLDRSGFRLLTAEGKLLTVPFVGQNLRVMQFGRTTGSAYFAREGSVPVLYLPAGGVLEDTAGKNARWVPIPAEFAPYRPIYVLPAPSWKEFQAMEWYPDMTCFGGVWGSTPHSPSAWTPGFSIHIGATIFPTYARYREYRRLHPTRKH